MRLNCPNCIHNHYWYLVSCGDKNTIVCKACDFEIGEMNNGV